jgi:hypothetical protein
MMKLPLFLVLVLTVVAFSQCDKPSFLNSGVDICELRDTPKKYADRKTITVQGEVISSYSLLGSNLYELSQPGDSCAINVVSTGASPTEGKHLTIEGQLKEGFKLGSTRMLVIVEQQPENQ